jgi:16S rRNA (uracil1498-N3)-methyltransferase
MRIPRVYTTRPLVAGERLALEQAPGHHLLRVLRLQPGDRVALFNGDGNEYLAVLESAEPPHALLSVQETTTPRRESPLTISVGQGVSRGERMDLVVQKSVELGVQAITPLWTRRSQVRLSGSRLDKRLSHWRGIIQSACEQSGRVRVPQLHDGAQLGEWLAAHPTHATGLVLDPQADITLRDVPPLTSVRLLVGPEGGLDTSELESACAAGYLAVRLGPRVLRTETATLAVLAALQTLWGDFG